MVQLYMLKKSYFNSIKNELINGLCAYVEQVRWFHNNLEAESDRYHYIHEGGFFCLDIVPVTLDDEGLWVCTAQNYAGKSSTAARLSLTSELKV